MGVRHSSPSLSLGINNDNINPSIFHINRIVAIPQKCTYYPVSSLLAIPVSSRLAAYRKKQKQKFITNEGQRDKEREREC